MTFGSESGPLPTINVPPSPRTPLSAAFVGNTLQVTTGGVASLTWTGSGGVNGNVWDLNTTQNWSNNNSTTTPNDTFYNVDAVKFTDSPSAPTVSNITLNTVVQPGSVTVNNASAAFSITGSGSIAGFASLSKQGAGTLTLGTNNTYTGPTNIGGGTLVLTGSIASTSSLTIGPSGTLQIGNSDATGNIGTYDISNSGSLIISRSDAPAPYANNISGAGSVLINGSSSAVITLSGPSSSYTGNTTLSSGTLKLGTPSALGSSISGNVIVSSGATLDLTSLPDNVTTFGSKTFSIAGTGVGGAARSLSTAIAAEATSSRLSKTSRSPPMPRLLPGASWPSREER